MDILNLNLTQRRIFSRVTLSGKDRNPWKGVVTLDWLTVCLDLSCQSHSYI